MLELLCQTVQQLIDVFPQHGRYSQQVAQPPGDRIVHSVRILGGTKSADKMARLQNAVVCGWNYWAGTYSATIAVQLSRLPFESAASMRLVAIRLESPCVIICVRLKSLNTP